MKETIDSIVEIDNKTKKIVKDADKKVEEIKEELKNTLTDMENKKIQEAKKYAQSEFEKIVSQGQSEIDQMKSDIKESLVEIEKNYEKNKDNLIEKAFEKIIASVSD